MTVPEPTVMDLNRCTDEFFRFHWNASEIGMQAPSWDGVWMFRGNIPNHDRPGCYALIDRTGQVLYIGVGARRGSGKYVGHGLGARLNAYFQVAQAGYGPASERVYQPASTWVERGLNEIRTIGFPRARRYLAYALESYLIARLKPRCNVIARGPVDEIGLNTA